MAEFTGEGPINTDDNALIEFHAPKSLHYETRGANTVEVRRVTVDPTSYAAEPLEPEAGRRHYVALAQAFRRRGMFDRAREILAAVPGLAESDEGRRVLQLIDTKQRGG